MRPCAGTRQRATAALVVRQQLHLVLLSCLVAPVRSAFTGVTLSGRDFGCFPTTFSANPSPTIAASPSSFFPVTGARKISTMRLLLQAAHIALLHDEAKAEGCTVSTRVALAKKVGAIGIVLRNYVPGEIPYMLTWSKTDLLKDVRDRTTSPAGIEMFACMVSYEDGDTLMQLATAETGDAMLSWSKFKRWAAEDEPATGTHSIFSVLSPQSLKDDRPAAQAPFNPESHPLCLLMWSWLIS